MGEQKVCTKEIIWETAVDTVLYNEVIMIWQVAWMGIADTLLL